MFFWEPRVNLSGAYLLDNILVMNPAPDLPPEVFIDTAADPRDRAHQRFPLHFWNPRNKIVNKETQFVMKNTLKRCLKCLSILEPTELFCILFSCFQCQSWFQENSISSEIIGERTDVHQIVLRNHRVAQNCVRVDLDQPAQASEKTGTNIWTRLCTKSRPNRVNENLSLHADKTA